MTVPTPFGFLEVEEEVLGKSSAQFGETPFDKTPATLAPIDEIFPACALVLAVVVP